MTAFSISTRTRATALALVLAGAIPLLGGCAHDPSASASAPTPATLRGIDFLAEVAIVGSPARVTGVVAITNRRETPVRLAFPDACVALLRVYELEDERLPPVWDQSEDADCAGEPAVLELGGGGVAQVRLRDVPVDHIRGDGPAGPYRFTAYLRPGGTVVEVEAGSADL